MKPKPYVYRVVGFNGTTIYGRSFKRCADARRHAEHCAKTLPAFGPFELERMLELPSGGRRYWVRQRSRWVPWDFRRDASERQPDWIYG